MANEPWNESVLLLLRNINASTGQTVGIGSPDDPAWTGTGPASLISVMKAVHGWQQTIAMEVSEIDQDMTGVLSLLTDIKTNTTPAG